jgi:Predicted membrane protein (DUF2142)
MGRVLNLPALTVLITMRLVGLFVYTFLVWLAIKIIPFGKWLLAVLVITPMAVYQASTISTDTVSNGIGFLFIACCLHFADQTEVNWKNFGILILLFFLLFSTKVNLAFLAFLPFIILRPAWFKMKRGYILLVLSAVLLLLLEVGGWNILAYSRFYTAMPGANPVSQARYILTRPFSIVTLIFSDLWTHIFLYIKGWIADYGYGYWGTPWFIIPIYLLALFAGYLIEDKKRPDKRARIALISVFGIGYLATLMSLYVGYTPVGSSEIQGVHGRYFIVIFPLLLLRLIGSRIKTIKLNRILAMRVLVSLTLICMFLFSVGMYLAFYVRCGTSYYQAGLCYQPVYKNWSPNSAYFQPITSDNSFTQMFIPKCNGMGAIRIWIDSTNADPNGETEFIVNDEEKDVIQADEKIANSALPDKSWYLITFPKDWYSGGKWYSLSIQNSREDNLLGIRVASSIRAEYIDGPLYQNGIEVDNDMIFQYGCTAVWPKLIYTITTLAKKK